jgi:CheY-like chemotaxis protein
MADKARVLAVDDEQFNLEILQTDLEEAGYEVICAVDGDMAMQKLEASTDIDVIVLDRMMPRMNGIEVLKKVKANPALSHIPVIMQTAAAQSSQVLEGIQAGAYYYLRKPYNEALLLSIVKAALMESAAMRDMRNEVRKQKKILGLIEQARFRFRTLEEVSSIAFYVANCCPQPEQVVYGLSELMINAVEHGNLGITYEEKKQMVMKGGWMQEVEKRLSLEENRGKYAILEFMYSPPEIVITIRDQGKGFDWKRYMEFSPERLTDPNGRGIAMSKTFYFPQMEFKGCGNEVICRVPVNAAK